MTAFIIYILKSTLCLSAFYLLYRLLFRGTTHFRFNRRVLLLGLLVFITSFGTFHFRGRITCASFVAYVG